LNRRFPFGFSLSEPSADRQDNFHIFSRGFRAFFSFVEMSAREDEKLHPKQRGRREGGERFIG
jgi:hypothetical protein